MNRNLSVFGDDSMPNDSMPVDTIRCDTNNFPVKRYSKHNGSEEWRAAHDYISAQTWTTKRGWSRFEFSAFTPPPGTHLVACTLTYRQNYAWCRPASSGYPHCEIDLLSIDPVNSGAQTIFDAFGTALATNIPSPVPLDSVKVALPPISISSGLAFYITLGWKVYEPSGDDPGPRNVNEFAYALGAGSGNSKPHLKLVYDF